MVDSKHVFKSGLRAGVGGFIASGIFFLAVAYFYQTDWNESDAPGWILVAFLIFATLPSVFCLPAMMKKVVVTREEKGVGIVEQGLFGTRKIFIENEASVRFRLRIFAGGGVSRLDLSGGPDCSFGRGLRDAELEKLFLLVSELCGQEEGEWLDSRGLGE